MGTHPIFESDFDCLTELRKMATLADELLADLEDEAEDIEDDLVLRGGDGGGNMGDMSFKAEVKMEEDEEIEAKPQTSKIQNIDDVDSVIELLHSQDFAEAIEQIRHGLGANPKPWFGLVEQNPEYQLVVKANELCSRIDNEIAIVHKFVQDMYQDRFPELAGMVPEPIVFLKTVNILMNDIEKGLKKLGTVLSSQTILIVSVTASTTSGKVMDDEKMAPLARGCEVGIELCEARDLILQFVESRMEFIAPNVCRIVGPGIAAKVTSHAGGLTGLTKMPSCNIMLLGAQKKTFQGFSKLQMLPHTGYIYYAKIVQDMPPEYRRKAAKLVSAKLALAARVDCFHQSDDGTAGKKLLDEIQTKFDKWFEPSQQKQTKALPVPLEAPRKKRGGRRARKMKERLGMTDMRKYANRMNFGEIGDDVDQSDLGVDMGQLHAKGASGSGKVRAAPVDKKTQVRISKALQQKIARNNRAMDGTLSVWTGGRTTMGRDNSNGMASSVAFTPLKGLEIINPNAAEKKEESKKYFSDTSGFTSVKPS